MADKKPISPIKASIAGGLLVGLGFSVVAPRLWNELEVSQGLTVLVIAVGFLLGATATYFAVRKKD